MSLYHLSPNKPDKDTVLLKDGRLLKAVNSKKNLWTEIDKNGQAISKWFNFHGEEHVELYLKNKNGDIVLMNYRAGSTSLVTAALYSANIIGQEQYYDEDFISFANLKLPGMKTFRSNGLKEFQEDRKKASKIYCIVNSDFDLHVMRKVNHFLGEYFKTAANVDDFIKYAKLCNATINNELSNFHYRTLCSFLLELKLSEDDITFYDVSKTDEFIEMFFGLPSVRHNVKHFKSLKIKDLTPEQRDSLYEIYDMDRKLFDRLKKNNRLII